MKAMLCAAMAALVGLSGLVGCADTVKGGTNQISGWTFKSLREGGNIFETALPGGQENDFDLKFSVQDGGMFSFTVNSDNQLKKGINFIFGRTGDKLNVQVLAQGNVVDVTEELAGMLGDLNGELSLKLTVHNGEDESSHIVFKSAAGVELFELHGEHEHDHGNVAVPGTDAARRELLAALARAEEHKHSPGMGEGTFFGFVTEKSTFNSMNAAKSEGH